MSLCDRTSIMLTRRALAERIARIVWQVVILAQGHGFQARWRSWLWFLRDVRRRPVPPWRWQLSERVLNGAESDVHQQETVSCVLSASGSKTASWSRMVRSLDIVEAILLVPKNGKMAFMSPTEVFHVPQIIKERSSLCLKWASKTEAWCTQSLSLCHRS